MKCYNTKCFSLTLHCIDNKTWRSYQREQQELVVQTEEPVCWPACQPSQSPHLYPHLPSQILHNAQLYSVSLNILYEPDCTPDMRLSKFHFLVYLYVSQEILVSDNLTKETPILFGGEINPLALKKQPNPY